MTYPHLGNRFLKDAMWKQDKKDFACEMGKLKKLKGRLALMEQDYLTEHQVRGRAAGALGVSGLSRHVSGLTCAVREWLEVIPSGKSLPLPLLRLKVYP